MATTLTPIDLVRDTLTETDGTALGAADTEETFEITLTEPGYRCIIIVNNLATNKALAVSVAKGDYWFATSAITGSVAAGKIEQLVFNAAGVKDKDTDKISVSKFEPGSFIPVVQQGLNII